MRARHLLVPLLALVPLVACSSDDIVDDLTGPTGLDVRGTYAITGSFHIYDVGALVDTYICSGTVAVPNQAGNQFSGTWILDVGGDCPAEFGGAITGSVNADTDEIVVDFVIPLRDEVVQAVSDCTITSGPDNRFYGFIDPDIGFVTLVAYYTADCTTDDNTRAYEFEIWFQS